MYQIFEQPSSQGLSSGNEVDIRVSWHYVINSICNSNWTEWSTIQGVIARVISKSDESEARGRFEITSTIIPWIVRHEVQLLINRIYNKFLN